MHNQPGGRRAPLNHAPGIDTVHPVAGKHAGAPVGRAEEGPFLVVADPGCLDIGIEIRFEIVVGGQLMVLAGPFSCSRTHQRLPLGW